MSLSRDDTYIMVVDDEAAVLATLSKILDRAGYRVQAYPSPITALHSLEDSLPGVIISDHNMPEMNGVDFFQRARKIAPNAVRILVTAYPQFDLAREAINAGEVFRFITKPWDVQELLNIVRNAMEAYLLKTENAQLNTALLQQNERLGITAEQLASANDALTQMNHSLEMMVLQRTQALLEGLIGALDYRDAETQWHSRRVAVYARRIAQELGVKEPDLSIMEHGALLHDIGKIGIADSVLLKPGKLTPEEWVEMKKHPEFGWSLLQRVDYLKPAAIIVLQHQEKYDGTGYPAGLKGNELSLGARIFHVVDTLDAITSDRPYRKGRSYEVARQEMIDCSGKHFDPKVVEAFLRIHPEEWERIRIDIETVAILNEE